MRLIYNLERKTERRIDGGRAEKFGAGRRQDPLGDHIKSYMLPFRKINIKHLTNLLKK